MHSPTVEQDKLLPAGRITVTGLDFAGLTAADLSAASRFADCCYDDQARMPSAAAMERLTELGIVTALMPGVYAETPLLRQLGY